MQAARHLDGTHGIAANHQFRQTGSAVVGDGMGLKHSLGHDKNGGARALQRFAVPSGVALRASGDGAVFPQLVVQRLRHGAALGHG